MVGTNSLGEPSVGVMYFSPTGTTAKICEAIAAAITKAAPTRIDLTKPLDPEKIGSKVDVWVIGIPVYASRLPAIANERISLALSSIEQKTCAVAVSVYGDVDGGAALKQLVNLISREGFKVIGAGEFIGEHFFKEYHGLDAKSTLGRPDQTDLATARKFGEAIRKKGLSGSDISSDEAIQSAKVPLRLRFSDDKRVMSLLGPIAVDPERCIKCQACVKACPVGCIDPQTFQRTEANAKACLGCGNCMKICPKKARSQTLRMKWLIKRMAKPHKERSPPVYYT